MSLTVRLAATTSFASMPGSWFDSCEKFTSIWGPAASPVKKWPSLDASGDCYTYRVAILALGKTHSKDGQMKPSRSEASRKPRKHKSCDQCDGEDEGGYISIYHEAMWVSCANSTLQTHIFVISCHLKSLWTSNLILHHFTILANPEDPVESSYVIIVGVLHSLKGNHCESRMPGSWKRPSALMASPRTPVLGVVSRCSAR